MTMISDLGVLLNFRSESSMLREAEQAPDMPTLTTKLNACLFVPTIAQLLYQARSEWIGGGTVPWNELTAGQKAEYRAEIERLIKEGK